MIKSRALATHPRTLIVFQNYSTGRLTWKLRNKLHVFKIVTEFAFNTMGSTDRLATVLKNTHDLPILYFSTTHTFIKT